MLDRSRVAIARVAATESFSDASTSMVAKVYFDCYDLRTRDNRERIQAEQSIRGGPKTSTVGGAPAA